MALYYLLCSFLKYLYDWHFIALCFSHVGNIILQLEARTVVIDILKDQVYSHERCGRHRFSLYNYTEFGAVFKVQPLGAVHADFTWRTKDGK